MVQAIDVGVVEGISIFGNERVPNVGPSKGPDAEQLLSDIDGFFTENRGQMGQGAGSFYCQGSPLSVSFGTGWVAYDLQGEGDEGVLFRQSFAGANLVEPIGVDPLPHRNNYFIGNDADGWVTGARNYWEVMFRDLYDGIDLRYHFKQGQLKYDFIVMPGADPSGIQLTFQAIEKLAVEEASGDLLITTVVGTVRDQAPWTYQHGTDGLVEIPSSYHLVGEKSVAISIGPYNQDRSLIIDPNLTFSTYLGGTLHEGAGTVACYVDDAGDVYVTGGTRSVNFPTTVGAYDTTHNGGDWDIFVSKLVNNGTALSFSTFIGGGTGGEFPTDFTVDTNGRMFVIGQTGSTDFPITPMAFQKTHHGNNEGFILKLNSTGQALSYSTYLGGSDGDLLESIAIDGQGNAYIIGNTWSNDLPVVAGCYDTVYDDEFDGFVVKLNSNGTNVIYGSYIGTSGNDQARALLVDAYGDVYVAGWTNANNFPVTLSTYDRIHNGLTDGYLLKMSGNLSSLVFSTYLGGSHDDQIQKMAMDDDGNIIVTGYTRSANFPTTPGAYDNTSGGGAFVTKFKASGNRLIFSTLFTGNQVVHLWGLATDASGSVFLTGSTESTDLPTTLNAYSKKNAGKDDAFIARLDPNGTELEHCTYLGGSGEEYNDISNGNAIHVGSYGTTVVGKTDSLDFPTTQGAYSTGISGDFDIFITRLPTPTMNETRPSAPVNLSAVAGDRSVTLKWDPPMDDGGYPVLSYTVYQGVNDTIMDPIKFLGPVDRSYNVTVGDGWVTYYYGVTARNLVGTSNMSTIINATPAGPPSTPQNLIATPGPNRIILSWTAPLLTGDVPLLGYRLFRSDNQFEDGQLVYTGPEGNFTDEGLENGRMYYYRLCAFNIYGNGRLTDPVAMAPAGPPSEPWYLKVTAGDGKVDLTWRPPLKQWGIRLLGYNVHRGSSEDTLANYRTLDEYATTFEDIDLVNGEVYFYAVQVFNIYGNSSLSNIVNATPLGLPGTPVNLNATGGDSKVTLTWEAPAIDGGAPIGGYDIFRGLSVDEMVPLSGVNGTNYNDNGLQNGQTYYYQVQAKTKVGEGPLSEIVFATPRTLPSAPGNLVIADMDKSSGRRRRAY
jgi:hypothetical protein